MSESNKVIIDEDQLASLRELNEDDEDDIVTELINIFVKHSPETLDLLSDAVKADDRPQVVKLAHKLKGSCANLGAEYMRNLCQDLEENGTSMDAAKMNSMIEEVKNAYSELVEVLDRDWRKKPAA